MLKKGQQEVEDDFRYDMDKMKTRPLAGPTLKPRLKQSTLPLVSLNPVQRALCFSGDGDRDSERIEEKMVVDNQKEIDDTQEQKDVQFPGQAEIQAKLLIKPALTPLKCPRVAFGADNSNSNDPERSGETADGSTIRSLTNQFGKASSPH